MNTMPSLKKYVAPYMKTWIFQQFVPELYEKYGSRTKYDIRILFGMKKTKAPAFEDEIYISQKGFDMLFSVGFEIVVTDKDSGDMTVRDGYAVFNT